MSTNNPRINHLSQQLQPLINQLRGHELYDLLNEVEDIRAFMELHVYAVWDFMSLLKSLQSSLTCTTIPWRPVVSASTARFINEIVMGEESDINEQGVPYSHYEMYLEAMHEVGASTDLVSAFVADATDIETISYTIASHKVPKAAAEFMNYSFDVIKTGEAHKVASAFTFGREDLIPDMFIEIVKRAESEYNTSYPKLYYYLNRHIEIDGDEHGPLSLQMVSELCGDDDYKWYEVEDVAKQALQVRINLWDQIAAILRTSLVAI